MTRSRSMSRAPLRPHPIHVAVALCLALCASAAENFTCATPSEAVVGVDEVKVLVRNECGAVGIDACLEYGGANFHMKTVGRSASANISTVPGDCWILRHETGGVASRCRGPIIAMHAVRTFEVLKFICIANTTFLLFQRNLRFDCITSDPPGLDRVYDAAVAYNSERVIGTINRAAVTQSDAVKPFDYVEVVPSVKALYVMAADLARRGVATSDAFNLVDHARSVVTHLIRCSPHLVGDGGRFVALPRVYLSVYGSAAALLEADAKKRGAWKPALGPLPNTEAAELDKLAKKASHYALHLKLPSALIPPPRLLTATRAAAAAARGGGVGGDAQGMQASAHVSAATGQRFCDSHAPPGQQYRFNRVTKESEAIATVDCCGTACFAFEAVSTATFSTTGFRAHCCLMCNLSNGCPAELKEETRRVLSSADIDVPEAAAGGAAAAQARTVMLGTFGN